MINLSCLSRQAIKYLDYIYVLFTYFNWNILIMIISRDLVRVQGDPGPSQYQLCKHSSAAIYVKALQLHSLASFAFCLSTLYSFPTRHIYL